MPAGAPGLKLQLLAAKKSRDAGLLTDAMRSPPLLTSRLQGEQWKRTTVRTALAFPGFVSAIFLTLNFLVRVAVGRCTLRVCQARLAQRTHCSWPACVMWRQQALQATQQNSWLHTTYRSLLATPCPRPAAGVGPAQQRRGAVWHALRPGQIGRASCREGV